MSVGVMKDYKLKLRDPLVEFSPFNAIFCR